MWFQHTFKEYNTLYRNDIDRKFNKNGNKKTTDILSVLWVWSAIIGSFNSIAKFND